MPPKIIGFVPLPYIALVVCEFGIANSLKQWEKTNNTGCHNHFIFYSFNLNDVNSAEAVKITLNNVMNRL